MLAFKKREQMYLHFLLKLMSRFDKYLKGLNRSREGQKRHLESVLELISVKTYELAIQYLELTSTKTVGKTMSLPSCSMCKPHFLVCSSL